MAEDFAIGKELEIPKSVLDNIEKIDKKINDISKDSELMAQKFNAAMTKMTLNSDGLLKKLTEMQNKINSMDISKFAQGVSNVGKGTTQIEQFSNAISKAAAAINKYNSSQAKQKTITNDKEIERINKEVEALKKKTEQLEKYRKKQKQVTEEQSSSRVNTKAIDAYNRAMASSEALVTQRINKIAKLRQAEEMLVKTGKDYSANIDKIRSEIERLNKLNQGQVDSYGRVIRSHQNLMNTSGQLMRKLALIFSVSQIQGYLLQIRDVTGEFEKQNTALASILQNKDKADKLFGQITELAVKSPFTLKELITYTKSLSAYQVEYEKLYDTTKMLADVSAGLGVDMQRLILAFGQVKASNFLRGTEVRQFTEAGFNILGELAEYYSKLENRMVSVGEVQERVTKRMVAFGDVEEIFKRVTSAGGIFYNMQEKQSETIAGLVSNLRDSIDLMLNDIGSANSGAIKQLILTVRSLYENWREVAWHIEKAVVALGAWKTATMLASLGNSNLVKSLFNVVELAPEAAKNLTLMQKAMIGLKAAYRGLLAGGALLLISWLVDLVRQSTEASRKAEQLSEALGKIQTESSIRASELSGNFKKLADEAVNAADGSEEQNEALKELNLTYAELVPSEMLKIENLRKMKGEYESVTSAIYSKIEAETKEKMVQQVSNVYGKDAVNAADNLSQKLTEYGISLSKAKTIVSEFRKEFDKGLVSSPQKAQSVLENLIKTFTGLSVSLTEKGFYQTSGGKTWGDIVMSEVDDVYNSFVKLSVETEKVKDSALEVFREGGGTKLYSQLKNELDKVSKYQTNWNKSNKGKFKLSIEFSEESKKQQIAQYQKFIDDINKKISSGEIKQADIVSANLIIEDAQKAIDKLNVSDDVQEIEKLRLEFSKLYNIDFGKLNFTKMLETQGFSEYIKVLDENISNYQKKISVFEEAAKRGQKVPAMQAKSLLNGKTLEQINKEYTALQAFRDSIYKDFDKKDKATSDSALKRLKEQISFLEKVNREYEKLLKNYNEEEAKQKILNSLKEEASQLGVEGILMSADFDDSGVLEAMEKLKALYPKMSQEMRIALAKAMGGIQLDMDIEVREDRVKDIQDQFSELFGSYELSLELDNLGLDKNLMSQLFNVEIFDLTELRKRIKPFKEELQNILGEDGVSAWDKMNKQISDAEAKELQERLKRYSQYLKQSVSERVAIEMEAQKKIAEVQKTNEFTPEQKKDITDRINKEASIKLDKLSWEEFQGTDTYIKLFEDLQYVSTNAINKMLSELSNLKDSLKNLPPEQLKEIVQQMQKLEDIKIQRNPFKYLFSSDPKESSKAWGELGGTLNEVSSAATDIASSLENVFGTMDDKTADIVSSFSEIASGLGNTASGVSRIMAGDWIGGGLQALTGLASTIGSIFAIGDKKKEREIQRQIELVENLQRSYEKLQEAIEGAYSIDTYKASYNQSIENLQAQNESYRQMIAAEQDKKKTDDDRIEEWQNKIQDNLDRIQELEEQFISDLGGFGSKENVKSAAQEFADAWLEAYMETGDGLDALSDKWDEYIQNIVAKQLMLKGTEKYLKPVMDMLDGMLEDSVFTPTEAQDIQDKIDEVIPQLNEFWKAIAGSFDLGAASEGDTMSGLSKSISSITEDTADALASITESIRFFSADSNGVLKQIYNWLINPPVESGIMQEMRVQSEQLRLMYSLWSSMSTTKAGVSGKALKVQIV